MEQEAVINK
ncbi:hypothetical protein ECTW07945_5481, partial [Escherichia coli TW07945]